MDKAINAYWEEYDDELEYEEQEWKKNKDLFYPHKKKKTTVTTGLTRKKKQGKTRNGKVGGCEGKGGKEGQGEV